MRKAGIRDSLEECRLAVGAALVAARFPIPGGHKARPYSFLWAMLLGSLAWGPALAQSAVPTPVLRIEATDVAPQVTLGSTRLFTFTVRNLQPDSDFVYGPRYRLTGAAGSFDGDTRDMLRANFRTSDSISFQLRAITVGQTRLSLSLDYVECAGGGAACAARTVSESFAVEILPVVIASATPTPTPTRAPTSIAVASPSATATAVVGLTISLALSPQNPVVGDNVSFVFTVSNLQPGVVARRPIYRLSGLPPNFEGDMSNITHEIDIAGAQTDTVQFNFRAVNPGVTQLRMQVDYLECRGTTCRGGFSQTPVFSIVTRGSSLTPIAESSMTVTPTPTRTPTNVTVGSPSVTPSPVNDLTISLAVFPQNPVVGDNVSFVFTVSNLQTGVVARRPIYRLSGLPPNFEGDMSSITHEVDIAGPQTDTVQFNFRAVNSGVTQLRMLVDYLECRGASCRGGFSQTPIYSIVTRGSQQTPVAEPSTTPTPTPSPTPSLASGTGLTIETEVIGSPVVGGDSVLFVFQVYNRQTGITAQKPTYSIVGLGGLFAGDTRSISRDTILAAQQPDSVVYRLTPIVAGVAAVRLQVNYEECRGAQCTVVTTISTAVPVQVRGSNTPVASATPSATPTLPSGMGLTIETEVVGSPVVGGDPVLFVFQVYNRQAGITAQGPTYSIVGVGGLFSGDTRPISRDTILAAQQPDSVVFRLTPIAAGVAPVRLQVNYEECRGAQCIAATTVSTAVPVQILANTPVASATPSPTPSSTPQATPSATRSFTSTPTLTAIPSPSVTATRTLIPTTTATHSPAFTPTRTATATVVATPLVTFDVVVDPPQPVVGQNVTVTYTIRNLQGPTTLRRQGYVISGVSPNLDGNIDRVERDVPILGTQVDTVVYRLRAVNEGTSLLQIHLTYEACGATLPCAFGAASSVIRPLTIASNVPTVTPTMFGFATPTPTASVNPTTAVTPVLVYSLDISPAQPFVGDVVDFVFSIRNVQGGTQAVRPAYHVTGTSPNFEDPIPATMHDVAIGGTVIDTVTYRLSALHEGTSLLQIHSTYDICNTGAQPCSFGNSSSQIFRVVVRDPPTPTPTVTVTSTATASFTPTPTQTPDGSETITPTPTETIVPRIVIADDDCSMQPQRLGRRGGWLPIWLGAVVLVWRRRHVREGRWNQGVTKAM